MSAGLLIITHDRLGANLLATATALFGSCPLRAEVISVALDVDTERLMHTAREVLRGLDQGGGVLVLTDMYGSTPGNIASNLRCDERVVVVAGINLPMLLRVLNYAHLPLAELAQKAISGGGAGILLCRPIE